MANDRDDESLTVQVLRSIRDELQQLRGENKAELRQLRTETVERLDHLSSGQIRLATEVAELRGAVDRQTARFDHFLETDGNAVRDLQYRVERLEDHTGLPRPRGR